MHDGFVTVRPNLRVSTGAAFAFRQCFLDHRLRDRAGLLERWREISGSFEMGPEFTRSLASPGQGVGGRRVIGNVLLSLHGNDRKRGHIHEADNRFHGSENEF